MFIIQFSNWMIPLFFARCLLCPNAIPSLAKNACICIDLAYHMLYYRFKGKYNGKYHLTEKNG